MLKILENHLLECELVSNGVELYRAAAVAVARQAAWRGEAGVELHAPSVRRRSGESMVLR